MKMWLSQNWNLTELAYIDLSDALADLAITGLPLREKDNLMKRWF